MHAERKLHAVCLAALVLLAGAGAASAQDNFKPLWGWQKYPGYLFYYMERPTPHRIEMRVVPKGVVTGYGLALSFPDVTGNPGVIFRELSRRDAKDYTGYEGFSTWVQGDGSDAKGAVVFGYSSGPTATFSLKDTTWHRVDLKWSDFTPAPETGNIGQLAFSLSRDSKRPATYTIDRPGFAKNFAQLERDDRTAGLKERGLRLEMGTRGPDFRKYVARGDQLAKTKAKLAAKKPLTVVAWGDSITNGAQLWTVGNAEAQDRAVYHSIFVEKLKKKYGYEDITRIKVAKGGYQTHQAWPNIQREVLDRKPDLVIMAVCAGDTIYSNVNRFKEHWTKIVEKLRVEGIEVICWVPTPIQFQVKRGDPFAEYVRRYAKDHRLPLVDQRACFMARGEVALGELIPDDAHPNPRGHELLAEVLFALFE